MYSALLPAALIALLTAPAPPGDALPIISARSIHAPHEQFASLAQADAPTQVDEEPTTADHSEPRPQGRHSDQESESNATDADEESAAASTEDSLQPAFDPDRPLTPMERKLSLIDHSLTVLAVMVLIFVLARRRSRHPIAAAGFVTRKHTFAEDSVLLPVLAFLFASVALSTILAQLGFTSNDVIYLAGAGSGAQLLGLLACLIVAAKQMEGGLNAFLFGPSETRRGHVRLTLVVLLLAVGLCPALLRLNVELFHALFPDYEFAPHATIAALERGDVSTAELVLLWAGAAVIAPIAEETFFRGLAQTWMGARLGRTWLAILLASVLFGLVHANVAYTIPPLIVLGIMLGWLYEKTGALWTVIVVHALFNLKTLVWGALIRQGAGSGF